MKIKRLADIPQAKANPDWFTGAVWHAALTAPPAPARLRMSRVRFEPGARTNWHTHPLGQTLWVVSGRGRVQVEGGPVVEIAAGDVVEFPPPSPPLARRRPGCGDGAYRGAGIRRRPRGGLDGAGIGRGLSRNDRELTSGANVLTQPA